MYDATATFPKEVRCIWSKKMNPVAILYLFIRYGVVLDVFFIILLSGSFPYRNTAVSNSDNSLCIFIFILFVGVTISLFCAIGWKNLWLYRCEGAFIFTRFLDLFVPFTHAGKSLIAYQIMVKA